MIRDQAHVLSKTVEDLMTNWTHEIFYTEVKELVGRRISCVRIETFGHTENEAENFESLCPFDLPFPV